MLIYISWQVPPLVKLAEPARQKHKLQPVTLFSWMHGVVVFFMHWILGQKLSNTSHNKAWWSLTTDSSLTTDTPQLVTLSFSRWIYSHAQVAWIEYKTEGVAPTNPSWRHCISEFQTQRNLLLTGKVCWGWNSSWWLLWHCWLHRWLFTPMQLLWVRCSSYY